MGETILETMDESGTLRFMNVQMCRNSSIFKIFVSVSRINQAGSRVMLDTPEDGSYVEVKKTGRKDYSKHLLS